MQNNFPRGAEVTNPEGGLPEMISPYLVELIARTGGADGPIGRQYIAQPEKERELKGRAVDPFDEDKNEVAPGLIYKYKGALLEDGSVDFYGRGLWTVTRFCASYCRFCFRGREVGKVENDPLAKAAILRGAFLSDKQLEEVFKYISDRPELNEIIVSGGDPFTVPQVYFEKIVNGLAQLQRDGKLDIVRFGTRLPMQNPGAMRDWHYELISRIKNPYILVHVNHSEELTEEAVAVLCRFRKECLANVLSHTVLLKGVNNEVSVLQDLFNKLTAEGVRPYYLFQNDPIYWADHFTVPLAEATVLWAALRRRLSGVAGTVKFTIEREGGLGKIPLPEAGAWDFDPTKFRDFSGNF